MQTKHNVREKNNVEFLYPNRNFKWDVPKEESFYVGFLNILRELHNPAS